MLRKVSGGGWSERGVSAECGVASSLQRRKTEVAPLDAA